MAEEGLFLGLRDSKAKMSGSSLLYEGLFCTLSWRERLRARTTQSGWHQLNLQTCLHPLQAPGRWERKRIRQQQPTQLLTTSHLKVFENPQAVSRARELSGVCAPVHWRLRQGVKGVSKTRGKESWRIRAKEKEKGGWEGTHICCQYLCQLLLFQ